MEKHQIIHKFRVENLSQKKGCGCKKKNFEEDKEMENPCQPGYIAYGTKEKDGRTVPNCVKEEQKKEDFVIPSPNADESESDFIGRCNSALYDEFPDDAQRNAVCYKSWRGE